MSRTIKTISNAVITLVLFLSILQLMACKEMFLQENQTLKPIDIMPSPVTSTRTPRTPPTISVTPTLTSAVEIPDVTPFPLEDKLSGRIIFNYKFIETGTRILYLNNFQEQFVHIPYEYNMGVYGDGNSTRPGYFSAEKYRPTFQNFAWSNSGNHIAFPCGNTEPEKQVRMQICIWDVHNLTYSEEVTPQTIEEYNISDAMGSSDIYIGDISWGASNNKLFFTTHPTDVHPGIVKAICFINRFTKEIDCEPVDSFMSRYSREDGQPVSDLQAIKWSPFESKYLALRDQSSLYLMNLEEETLSILWEIQEGFFQPDGKLLWYEDGKKVAFVIDNEENNNTAISVDILTKEVTYLFDYQDVYSQIAGIIPAGYHCKPTQIYISAFSPTEQYLLFEIDIGYDSSFPPLSIQNDQALGLFLYEMKTEKIHKVRGFVTNSYGDWRIHLNPDWGG